jgi:cation diffusion facilitator family transporter
MLSDWLVRRFAGDPLHDSRPEVRVRVGVLEGWLSIVVNLLVFLVKLIPGLVLGSVSLVADAVHSLADVVTSGVVIWSFRTSERPPDKEHPFGHGRVESLATLVIAILLLVAAMEFAVVSVQRLLNPRAVLASPLLLVVLAATLVLKEWLARFSSHLGRAISSPALMADSWHHRSDALATAVVLVALAGERLGFRHLDGAAGLVVGGFIAVAAVRLIKEAADPLIGGPPDRALLESVRSIAMRPREVVGLHDIMVHSYGRLRVISLHVEVPADLSLARAHEVAESVERDLAEELGSVPVVHVDPVDHSHPLFEEAARVLDRAVAEVDGLSEYHDLRIVCGETHCRAVMDIVVQGGEPDRIAEEIRRRIKAELPAVSEVVVEPDRVLVF